MRAIICDLCGRLVIDQNKLMIIQLQNSDCEVNNEVEVCTECAKAYVRWQRSMKEDNNDER